jgi:hypothetical protein
LLPIAQQHIAATGKGFQFMLQEATTTGIRLIYSTYKTSRPIRLTIRDTEPLSCIAIALRHDRVLNIEGLGVIRLKEGQFNALYAPQCVIQSLHQPDQESITLSILFDSRIWEEAKDYFPAVQSFLAKMSANQPALLLESNGWITRDIRDSLYRLVHTDKTTTGFPLYFGLATRLVLFQLLRQSQKQQPPSPYTNDEIDGIHAAREMIRDNIRRHFAIPEIAKRAGINEFKLKTGFHRQIGKENGYGQRLFSWNYRVRRSAGDH